MTNCHVLAGLLERFLYPKKRAFPSIAPPKNLFSSLDFIATQRTWDCKSDSKGSRLEEGWVGETRGEIMSIFGGKGEKLMTELRRAVRIPASSSVTLTWTDINGEAAQARARLRDVSALGLRAVAGRRIGAGTYVYFIDRKQHMSGGGYVKYCKRGLFRHEIGVELKGPLVRPL
jgi:hypothetical protein